MRGRYPVCRHGIYKMNSGNIATMDIHPVIDGIPEFTIMKNMKIRLSRLHVVS